MLMSTIICSLILLVGLIIPSSALASNDSLAIQACTCYYHNPDDNCEAVVKAIRARYSSDFTKASYIELGDPSKPAIVFLHGWPDSPMEWINQIEYFCMPPNGRFYCIALAITNYVPDLPNAPPSELSLGKEVDRFAAVANDLQLKNVTWAIHDWGVFLGLWVTYKYPELVGRLAVFDVGNLCTNCSTSTDYQVVNTLAFHTQNTSMTRDNAAQFDVPCLEMAVWRTAWPYADIRVGNGSAWVLGMFSDGQFPPEVMAPWKFSFTPDMPLKPMIFFWGNMTLGVPRTAEFMFFSSDWLTYVESTPFGEVVESAADHWVPSRGWEVSNIAMDNWLIRQNIVEAATEEPSSRKFIDEPSSGISTEESSSDWEPSSSQRISSMHKCLIYVILIICCAFW